MAKIQVERSKNHYIFVIDRTRRIGSLQSTREATLYYDLRNNTWTGDEIDDACWTILSRDHIQELVELYGLMNYIEEA